MSSKKWIWAAVLIVIILLGFWYFGMKGTGNTATTKPAAVTVATTNAMASQNAIIKADVTTLDNQIAALNASLAITGATTKPQISIIATNFKAVTATYAKIVTELRSAMTNAQTAGVSVAAAQTAANDLNMQLSNMTSQYGTAAKNVAAGGSTAATIATSLKQMQAAAAYNTAARADVQSIMQTLGIK